MSALSAIICFSVSLLLLNLPNVHGGAGWEYSGSLGPDKWPSQYPDCGGRMQSPINIVTNKILFDPNLLPFNLQQYAKCSNCNMTLHNVGGHTAEVKFSGQPIVISGGSLPDDYVLDQFHFHWGAYDDIGSEHMINSRAEPMEMHIVHHMRRYNQSDSLTHPYGLAVLGFFFRIGGHNANFDKLLDHFDKIRYKDNETELEPFALADLLPDNALSYYRYYGSLTTPPCYETVIWTLFTERIEISEGQINKFRMLQTTVPDGSGLTNITNDFRPLQELHERNVVSNDRQVQDYIVNKLVTDLSKEIMRLQRECQDSNGAPARLASSFCVIRLLTSLGAVVLLLGWKAVGTM